MAWLISGLPDRSSTLVDTVTGEMFFFFSQMNYEGSTHPMSRLQEDAKKGLPRTGSLMQTC